MSKEPRLILGTHGLFNWRKFTFGPHEIATHKHVIGLTGQGKSKAIASYAHASS